MCPGRDENHRGKCVSLSFQAPVPMKELTAAECMELMESHEDLLFFDKRGLGEFCDSFVPGSILFRSDLLPHLLQESLISKDAGVVLVVSAKDGPLEEELSAGLEGWSIRGVLYFRQEEWLESGGSIDMVIGVESVELAMDIPYDERLVIMDVRDPVRFAEGHAAGALNLPLRSLTDPGSMAPIQETDNLYIHGVDDREGVLAACLLKRQGYHNLRVVEGGWEAVEREAGIVKEKDPGALN